jgi:DNA-binding winged helix-turn-helix (wHTH) protein
MANAAKHLYEFGPFHIDAVERVLYCGEKMIPLTPKAIDTLLVLVANPKRLMDKDELLKLVYPDTFVEENALAKNISALRKVLENGAEESQYIQTVSKRGYRFVADVKDVSAVKDEPEPAPRPGGRWLAWLVAGVLVILLGWWAYPWMASMIFPPGNRPIHSLFCLWTTRRTIRRKSISPRECMRN